MFKFLVKTLVKGICDAYLKSYIVKTIVENDQKLMLEHVQKASSALTNITAQSSTIGYTPKISSDGDNGGNSEKNRIGFI